ncbi:enterochelin esterase domain-containing protein [Brevibacterium atlanticum]|uniref:enterochelin esterase domain-containing protein n=1 Tax=Brevibacterium atlanticum TaxID=2697563 RepID=UPI0014226E17|nr:alpha/beta hydrolase-fold protein [Brevibacterium atlanticum]
MRFTDILDDFSEPDAAEPGRAGAESGRAGAGPGLSGEREQRFWDQIALTGTPLVDPCPSDPALRDVTFVYRSTDVRVRSVRLAANRVTDKDQQAAGIMSRVPGTGIWGVTLTLPADLRCSYGFSPSYQEVAPPLGGPSRPGPPVLVDPFNPDPPLTRPDQPGDGEGSSVFSGPLAPDHSVWLLDGTRGAGVPATNDEVTGTLAVAGGPHLSEEPGVRRAAPTLMVSADREIDGKTCPVRVSLPTSPPAGLLVLFDGRQWFDHLRVAQAVEAAGLPGLIIIGLGTYSTVERTHTLAGNHQFLRSVAADLVPEIEAEAAVWGSALPADARRIIGGQSLGGLSALLMAQTCPGAFDAVLAHSPSLWWSPGGTATPADLASIVGDDWTTRRFLEPGVGAGTREFHLAVGHREGLMVDRARRLTEVLDSRGFATSLSVYTGGHDFACWRGELIDGLRRVFAQD